MDDAVLADYISTFYGYGNYEGRWWLVGMEEGGGSTLQEIQKRLQLWDSRGRRELEDVTAVLRQTCRCSRGPTCR